MRRRDKSDAYTRFMKALAKKENEKYDNPLALVNADKIIKEIEEFDIASVGYEFCCALKDFLKEADISSVVANERKEVLRIYTEGKVIDKRFPLRGASRFKSARHAFNEKFKDEFIKLKGKKITIADLPKCLCEPPSRSITIGEYISGISARFYLEKSSHAKSPALFFNIQIAYEVS